MEEKKPPPADKFRFELELPRVAEEREGMFCPLVEAAGLPKALCELLDAPKVLGEAKLLGELGTKLAPL